ncbi:MAG: tRNA (adenosine(37)-N6)-dimethylallyltransferase MiaA [Thermodesulfovibrionales bacterium]|nr:tRNA (adenosine(37)-N6)-dimethylallyltransferase MiaA [Thermodesulfovibrionales bacterium]
MKKIILILGPTAVGKTELAISLAKSIQSEIISADSMQIYKYMDIGTAKPSINERLQVPHHMIDIVEPYEKYSVGNYLDCVKPIIEKLHKSNKIPIITGGTGLYMKAMTRGLFTGPQADYDLRKKLLDDEKNNPGTLYEYLIRIDPNSANKIKSNDFRRILRAIEVFMKTSKPISEIQDEFTKPLPYKFIKIGITTQREFLYNRINQRVDAMIEKGLIEEVKRAMEIILDNKPKNTIQNDYDYLMSLTSMQAIGYKEIIMSEFGLIEKQKVIDLIKQKTRNYAKRQFTWFNAEKDIIWIDNQSENLHDKAIEILKFHNCILCD